MPEKLSVDELYKCCNQVLMSKQAINEPVPSDWCYVYSFKDVDAPIAVPLEEFQKKQKDLFSHLEDEAQAKGFSIRKTVSGLLIVPV